MLIEQGNTHKKKEMGTKNLKKKKIHQEKGH